MDKRIQHVDIAKGISISLVALNHSQLIFYFPQIIDAMSLFRMPLFFFLSGVFFHENSSLYIFIKKKFDALLKPYFVVLFAVLCVNYVLGEEGVMWKIKGIFYGNNQSIRWGHLWFLTHLFAVYVFSYLLFRFLNFRALSVGKKTTVLIAFISLGSLFIDSFWNTDSQGSISFLDFPGLPFSLDVILITAFYFICGSLCMQRVICFQPNMIAFLIMLLVYLLICFYTDAYAAFAQRIYDDPIFSTLGAFCGIYLILSMAWWISKIEKISALPLRLGKASLFILIFHVPIQNIFFDNVSVGITDRNILIFLASISFVISVFIPLFIRWLILKNRFLRLAFLPLSFKELRR